MGPVREKSLRFGSMIDDGFVAEPMQPPARTTSA